MPSILVYAMFGKPSHWNQTDYFWWNIKYEMTNEHTSNRLDLGINILYNLSWKCKILYHEEGLLLIL